MAGKMALVRRIGFTRFSRWGENLGRLHVSAATHADALDGTDELKITCDEDLQKGDRIVWIDQQGECHEHMVDEFDRIHDDSGAPKTKATCINSIAETWDDWVDDKRPSGGVSVALASILSGTRWDVGTCDQGGSASHTFYHQSVRESIAGICKTWGGELETALVHDGAGIVSRRVGIRAKRGRRDSAKRFTWTKDLLSVKRTVSSDNPKTRVYGYGKGVETDGGGFGRRLTFGSINGGKDYVEDAEAAKVWGHPDGKGGVLPSVCSYVNEQCEDASQLLQETRDYLEKVKEPKVTYTASVIDLYAFGRSWEGVGVGDDVAIIDKGFSDDGIRLHGRVSKIERDLLAGDATVTFGNLSDAMADMWQGVSNAISGNSQQNALYDAAAGTSVAWLIQLQAALNAQFNAVGTYKVETFELGTIWSNVPISAETGLPLKSTSGMWAVNINGAGIRLAANLAPNGQWDWRTFITGAQVSADAINAGTMRAERIRAGLLTDELGDNFWNLSSGDFSLSANAVLGGKTVDALMGEIDGLDNAIDGLDKTIDGIATDGIITEAERAAVSKILQSLEKEYRDIKTDYGSLMGNTSLNASFKSVLSTQYDSVFGERGTYPHLLLMIENVVAVTTASDLTQAMQLYDAAYSNYSATLSSYKSAVRQARNIIEQTQAQQKVDILDDSLDQMDVFNRLTQNGRTQGVYMKGGLLYVNATYMATGTLSDVRGRNTWNLNTGKLTTNYMTANNISANGTFECGSASNLLRVTGGAVYGYENGEKIGHIDFSAHSYNIDNPSIKYRGIQMTANGTVRISTPQISTAVSNDQSVTATICHTGNHTMRYIKDITDKGNGVIGWSWRERSVNFKNGLCTWCSLGDE